MKILNEYVMLVNKNQLIFPKIGNVSLSFEDIIFLYLMILHLFLYYIKLGTRVPGRGYLYSIIER